MLVMPILHDNRNMRPDLLRENEPSVDDIFANADAKMEQQRRDSFYKVQRKRIDWRKRIKTAAIITSIAALIVIVAGGIWTAKLAHNTMVTEVQTQVFKEVAKMKADIAAKDESELTEEDYFLLEVFEILPDEDIAKIIQTATSPSEIIQFMQNPTLDMSKYLTIEQRVQLEALMEKYAIKVGTRIEEVEQQLIEAEQALQEQEQTEGATEATEATEVTEGTEAAEETTS